MIGMMEFSRSLFLVEFIPIIVIILLLVPALGGIRRSAVAGAARVLWVLFVIFVPIVGPICWFIVGAGRSRQKDGSANKASEDIADGAPNPQR